jgi:uncharacterized cupredoxin-like copper-binding protein
MRARIHKVGAGLLVGAVLALAGCGGGSSAGTAAPPADTTSTASAPAVTSSTVAAAGTQVTVTEKEFTITLSQSTFSAGAYTFNVTNAGTFPHNLVIEGPGVDSQASPTLQPGQSAPLDVTLQAGSYEMWCAVDSHKDRGMDIHITVT